MNQQEIKEALADLDTLVEYTIPDGLKYLGRARRILIEELEQAEYWGSSITESIEFQHEQKLKTAEAREKLELARICRKRIEL